MKLGLLLCLGSVLVAVAENLAAWCVPGGCKVDSNCADSIHPGVTGKCCGGTCVRSDRLDYRQRLIGERCAPTDLPSNADNYEQCFAQCSGGLFCNTVDERCHAKHGVGCPCQDNRECLSNICRTESHVCAGSNLPYGEGCEQNNECQSNLCVNKKCSALAIGEFCYGVTPCVPGAVCRRNESFGSTYCLSPCAVGEANCCFSGPTVCAKTPANLVCNYTDYSCVPPAPLPDLGETCSLYACRNSTTMVCAYSCDGGGCNTTRVCQLKHQVATGLPCDSFYSGDQCVAGTSCNQNASSIYVCTALPTFPPTGSPTGAPTVGLNSVPPGQPCGRAENYNLCMAPGNMCELNETGTFVCKQSGTTPIGAFCSISSLNIDTRALDECVKGSRCTFNATGYRTCRTPIPVGQRCESNSVDYSYPVCESGRENCEMTGQGCFGCASNDVNGKPCCTCIAPRTVADGMNCTVHSQCQKATSLCHPSNRTCVNMQGIDCNSPNDCLDVGSFDCNCDRKCYLLNAPTPWRSSYAPTASTRAPTIPPPPRCDAQKKAWDALSSSTSFPVLGFPVLSYAYFHTQFLPQTLLLTEADQAIVIAYACCETCPRNNRFNSHIYASYQVDCGAKKLIKLEDTCNDLRATWALANCWGALSAASSLDMGFAFVATLLVVFF